MGFLKNVSRVGRYFIKRVDEEYLFSQDTLLNFFILIVLNRISYLAPTDN